MVLNISELLIYCNCTLIIKIKLCISVSSFYEHCKNRQCFPVKYINVNTKPQTKILEQYGVTKNLNFK